MVCRIGWLGGILAGCLLAMLWGIVADSRRPSAAAGMQESALPPVSYWLGDASRLLAARPDYTAHRRLGTDALERFFGRALVLSPLPLDELRGRALELPFRGGAKVPEGEFRANDLLPLEVESAPEKGDARGAAVRLIPDRELVRAGFALAGKRPEWRLPAGRLELDVLLGADGRVRQVLGLSGGTNAVRQAEQYLLRFALGRGAASGRVVVESLP